MIRPATATFIRQSLLQLSAIVNRRVAFADPLRRCRLHRGLPSFAQRALTAIGATAKQSLEKIRPHDGGVLSVRWSDAARCFSCFSISRRALISSWTL